MRQMRRMVARVLAGCAFGVPLGCAEGEDGDAYVLTGAPEGQEVPRTTLDGAEVDPFWPVAAAPGAKVDAGDGVMEVGPGELASVGSAGRIELYAFGVELEPDLAELTGPVQAAEELMDTLGLDGQRTRAGWMLQDPDLWSILAEVDLEDLDPDLTVRPVSALDLPGTAPLGDPGAPARAARAVSRGVAELFGADGGHREVDPLRARAEALFSLSNLGPDGRVAAPTLPPTAESVAAVGVVGRYCWAGTALTLGANGIATRCVAPPGADDDGAGADAAECLTAPWRMVGDAVLMGDAKMVIEVHARGNVLDGAERLYDANAGGCR